jgi:hypothetical protein
MTIRSMSKETWVELNDTIVAIKRRARQNEDLETIRLAERRDVLLQGLGIEIKMEDLSSERPI